MKILLVMDTGILVPPIGYGGHERLVAMFAEEYTRLGHEVHLLVTEGSEINGCTIHGYGKEGFPPTKTTVWLSIPYVWWFVWKNRNQFDLVHNFGRLLFLLPILNHSIKKIMTYGRIIDSSNIKIINKLFNKNIVFTAPSNWCVSTGNVAGRWVTIYNAINFSNYTLQRNVSNDAPLIFLSRLEKLKGAHLAIKIALETKNSLIIAGNISPLEEEQKYFKTEIEPYIDGTQIIYVGTLDDNGKNKYLGMAKAMIFPALTKEAFGMVMVESMACGTPVIALNHSAMPEVIDEGKTGFIAQDYQQMVALIDKASNLDRTLCRLTAYKKFDVRVIANNYLNLFCD